MPTTSDEIREQLNMKDTVYALENAFRTYLPAGHTVGQARPLFKRIEKALADEYRLRFSGQKKWTSSKHHFYSIACCFYFKQDRKENRHLIIDFVRQSYYRLFLSFIYSLDWMGGWYRKI